MLEKWHAAYIHKQIVMLALISRLSKTPSHSKNTEIFVHGYFIIFLGVKDIYKQMISDSGLWERI
jgi:hypothetical protein